MKRNIKILTIALLRVWDSCTAPHGAVALPNQLGGLFEHGRETLQIDPSTTFPVASKNLLYKRGSPLPYAALADGVNLPLGVSPDAPTKLATSWTWNASAPPSARNWALAPPRSRSA